MASEQMRNIGLFKIYELKSDFQGEAKKKLQFSFMFSLHLHFFVQGDKGPRGTKGERGTVGIRGDPVRIPHGQSETRVCGKRGLKGRILLSTWL